MRPRFIKIIRRLLIGVIFIVFLAVLSNYMQIWRSRTISARKPPKILGSDMLRSAEGLEYFDYRAGTLRFKIRARKLLETREGKNHLEGIEAYGFNPDGSTRNEIRSQNAVYDQDHNTVDFLGDVQLFPARDVELRTNSLHYDLNTNIGTTRDLLQFRFKGAGGTARGMRFDQKENWLELERDVDFDLERREPTSGNAVESEKVHATSDRAYCSIAAHRILFQGKARIESASGELSGDTIEVMLSPDQKRIMSLNAAGNADYRSEDDGERRVLSGERMVFAFRASGVLEQIKVLEKAAFSSTSLSKEMDLRGGEVDLEFDETGDALSQIQSRSGVQFRMSSGAKQTLISGDQLAATFMQKARNVENLEVRKHASFSVSGAGDSSDNELEADVIRISFRDLNGNAAAEKLHAAGSTQWRLTPAEADPAAPRKAAWTLAASQLEMLYSSNGDFLESGSASENVVISGNSKDLSSRAQVRRLQADSVRFRFFPQNNSLKDLDAVGGVHTAYEEAPGSVSDSAGREFHTASDEMRVVFEMKSGIQAVQSVTQWGNFKYEDSARSATAGRCDYDAAKEILVLKESPAIFDELGVTTGDIVEYSRAERELSVRGKVRSTLGAKKGGKSFFGSSSSSSSVVITAGRMQYWTEGGRALYTKKVQLFSEDQQLQAQSLELFDGGKRLKANGDVLHLISERETPHAASRFRGPGDAEDSAGRGMTVRSSELEYLKESNTIKYSGQVRLKSGDVELFSEHLDAVLDDEGKNVERAVALVNVFIRQGSRECKGEKAEWYLNPGKFVVLGNPAEAYDPGRGRSFARRLTSFTADDRILLESW